MRSSSRHRFLVVAALGWFACPLGAWGADAAVQADGHPGAAVGEPSSDLAAQDTDDTDDELPSCDPDDRVDYEKPTVDPYAVKGNRVGDLTVTLADLGILDWQYPIAPSRVAGSGFGGRQSPVVKGRYVFHRGQDIGCAVGEPVYAAADGVVRASMMHRTAGNFIVLMHSGETAERVETRYLHLVRRRVGQGAKVSVGDIIGYCGNTGASTNPHLHFEVKVGGAPVAPFRFPSPEETVGESDTADPDYFDSVPEACGPAPDGVEEEPFAGLPFHPEQ